MRIGIWELMLIGGGIVVAYCMWKVLERLTR